mgnify:CR=1 FL=1
MIRLMEEEIAEALEQLHPGEAGEVCPEEISIATGRLAAPYIEQYVERVCRQFPGKKVMYMRSAMTSLVSGSRWRG